MIGFLHIPEQMKDDLKDRLTAEFITDVAKEIFNPDADFDLYYCGSLCPPEAKFADYYYNWNGLKIKAKKVEETTEDQSREEKNKQLLEALEKTEQALQASQKSLQESQQAIQEKETALQQMIKSNDHLEEKVTNLEKEKSGLLMKMENMEKDVQQLEEEVKKLKEQQQKMMSDETTA